MSALTFDLEQVRLRQKYWLNELRALRPVSSDSVEKERFTWFAFGMAFTEVVAEVLSGKWTS